MIGIKIASAAVANTGAGAAMGKAFHAYQACRAASVAVQQHGIMRAAKMGGMWARQAVEDRIKGLPFVSGFREVGRRAQDLRNGRLDLGALGSWTLWNRGDRTSSRGILGARKRAGKGVESDRRRGLVGRTMDRLTGKPEKGRKRAKRPAKTERKTAAEAIGLGVGAKAKRSRKPRRERAPREPRKPRQERAPREPRKPRQERAPQDTTRPRRTRAERRQAQEPGQAKPKAQPEAKAQKEPRPVRLAKRDQAVSEANKAREVREAQALTEARRARAKAQAADRLAEVRRSQPIGQADRSRATTRAQANRQTWPRDREGIRQAIEGKAHGARATGDQRARLVGCSRGCEGRGPREVIEAIQARRKMAKGQVRDHCGMAILSAPEGRQLSDQAARQAAEAWMVRAGMDPERMQWAAYKHTNTKNHHVHLVFSRVRDDGKVWHCKHANAISYLEARALDRDAGGAHAVGVWQPGSGQAARAAYGKMQGDALHVEWKERGKPPEKIACQGPEWAARRAAVDVSEIEREGVGGWFAKAENFGGDEWAAGIVNHCERAGSARRV